ncbi:MAG TPA: sugar ABC transporter permease [Bacilli bacterium]|nr:sugar ABC transporter permease [Bacilli bacterium]
MADVQKPSLENGKEKKNVFLVACKAVGHFLTSIGKSIGSFLKKLGLKIGRAFKNLWQIFVDGSIGTKLSFFFCGSGNLYHKQFFKGFLYLIFQIAFILFMVLCPEINNTPYGWKALRNLALMGNPESYVIFRPGELPIKVEKDDSKLLLLFGLVTIAVVILYIIVWFSNIKSSYKSDQDVKAGRKPTSFKQDMSSLLDNRFHFMMLTPTAIAALIFTVIPTIFMICMAFTTYNDFDMNAALDPYYKNLFHWNGLTNFLDIFEGSTTLGREIGARFFPVLGWTMVWAVFATFTCYFGGILLAILINKKGIRFKKVFRTVFILTIAIPQFISLLAMRNILSGQGPVNQILQNLGWIDSAIGFLGNNTSGDNPYLAKFMVILINMWLGIPYTMLMTSGILMNIPSDLYEAARVDGATKTKMLFKITFPYIIFVTTPYLISSFIGNINSFNTIFLLTGGGPNVVGGTYVAGETDLLVTWLYKLTITNGEYNTGAVIGIFTFLITATITLITYRRSKAYKEEDTFQ